MAGSRKSGGTNVALTTRSRYSGGAWVALTTAKRKTGGVWVDLFPSSPTAATTDRTVSAVSLSPTDATTSYVVNTSGVIQEAVNGVTTNLETWILSGVSSDFEVRATAVSGAVTSGTMGTWIAATTSPVWTKNRINNASGIDTASFTLEIRRVSDSVVVDSSTITMSAEVII